MVIEVMQEEVDLQRPLENQEVEELATLDGEAKQLLVHLHAMGEGQNTNTMQLKGLCKNKQVHVLIDSGASHNFIHPCVLRRHKAEIKSIKPVKVRLASGDITESSGVVEIALKLQQFIFTI